MVTGPGVIGAVIKSTTLPIQLRPAVPERGDGAALADLFSNPKNTEMDPNAKPLTAEVMTERVGNWQKEYASDKPARCNLIVETAPGGEFLGIGGFGSIKYFDDGKGGQHSVGDGGVMFNASARGKGYGTEAMKLSIKFAFEVLKLDEVTVHTDVANAPMVKVMDRIGWKGVEEDGEFGGRVYAYSVKKEEWEHMKW